MIQLRTSLFLLSCVLNTMKDISCDRSLPLPSPHPDIQKYLLSLFFPERDHIGEAYLLSDSPVPPAPVERRLSVSQ